MIQFIHKGDDSVKKYKMFSICVISLLGALMFSFAASANSSWVWISETRPYDILPFVIIGTLLIETVSMNLICKIDNWYKTFFAVLVGNIISFIAPYIGYSNSLYGQMGYTLSQIIDRGPYYTVGTAFLLLTLIIELTIVYFILKKDSDNKKKLAVCIVMANVVTTVLVALTERTLCQGHW